MMDGVRAVVVLSLKPTDLRRMRLSGTGDRIPFFVSSSCTASLAKSVPDSPSTGETDLTVLVVLPLVLLLSVRSRARSEGSNTLLASNMAAAATVAAEEEVVVMWV